MALRIENRRRFDGDNEKAASIPMHPVEAEQGGRERRKTSKVHIHIYIYIYIYIHTCLGAYREKAERLQKGLSVRFYPALQDVEGVKGSDTVEARGQVSDGNGLGPWLKSFWKIGFRCS